MAEWNSLQYEKFLYERTLPAIDLANRIMLDSPKRIIDVGCGPGNSTVVLKKRYPNAYVIGVDNSQNMIDRARSSYPDIEFELFDASCDFDKLTDKFDIVFSNACIQWIPDHSKLLRNFMNILNDGGVMAVQIPMNYEEPIHKIIMGLSASEKWKNKFTSPRVFYNLSPELYFDLLSDISSDFSVWQTIYCHRMPSHESIIEWYRGTGLRPYLIQLDSYDAVEFESDVYSEIVHAYSLQTNGEIMFRFPRFFFIAVK